MDVFDLGHLDIGNPKNHINEKEVMNKHSEVIYDLVNYIWLIFISNKFG